MSAAYVGYVSFRADDRVSTFTMDPDTGKLTWKRQVQVEGGPDCWCLTRQGTFSTSVTGTARDLPATGSIAVQATSRSRRRPMTSSRQTKSTALNSDLALMGAFFFVITRGRNSIASFMIDAVSGALTAASRVPTEPDARPLALDPEGLFAVAAGGGMSNYGRLATYSIDQGSGQLTPL